MESAGPGREKSPSPPSYAISPAEVREHLAHVLNSAEFEHSDRSRPLLQYLVESAVGGREGDLKETLIGLQVFDRDATYNPKVDPVVRVTVGRLRSKLEKYYRREGARDAIRIAIPKGSYVPVFERFGLQSLADPLPAPAPPASRRGAVIAGCALSAAAVMIAAWLVRQPHAPALDHLRPFISTGIPYHPAFSPAGNVLAFDEVGPGDRYRNIFLQRLDATSPTRLGDDTANEWCPVWSPDGNQLAYLRELSTNTFGVFVVPVVGGNQKKLTELGKGATNWLSWSPDGRWLAGAEPAGEGKPGIVLISAANGEKRILTNSPPDWHGDSLPVFSADSKTLAFRRTRPLSGQEDIYTVPVSGGPIRRITFDDRGISGLALLRDGSLLWTSKRAGSIRSLWWQAAGSKSPERVTAATVDTGTITTSRDGTHFALVPYFNDVNIWSVPADGGAPARQLIESELPDSSPQYSPDGRRTAFHSVRTGSASIWLSDSTGGNPVLLADGKGFDIGNEQWSPDGRQIVFEWHISGKSAIYAVSSDGGAPHAVMADAFDNGSPVWSPDGAWIYFTSNRGGQNQIWRVPSRGGAPTAVIATPSVAARFARDDDALYYVSVHPGDAPREVYRQALRDGLPIGQPKQMLAGLAPADWPNWAPLHRGIYYLHRERGEPSEIQYLDFATHAVRSVWKLEKPAPTGGGLAVSPNGRTILFTQTDREGSAIYVQ